VKRVVFSRQAKQDLQSIADHIALDNPSRAVTFIEEIEDRCLALGDFPLSTRPFPELGSGGHILPHGNYMILYRNLATELSIERVLHGARDILAVIANTR
jgi:toxin ParE1/3/4